MATKDQAGAGVAHQLGRARGATNNGSGHHSRYLACPLAQLDPLRYSSCVDGPRLENFDQVTKHLLKHHSIGIYPCENCWAEWTDPAAWEEHIRDFSCQSMPRPDKFTNEEQDILKGIKRSSGSDHEQSLRALWQTLFPDHAVPDSTQAVDHFDALMPLIRVFFGADLEKNLPSALQRRGIEADPVLVALLVGDITQSLPTSSTSLPKRYRHARSDDNGLGHIHERYGLTDGLNDSDRSQMLPDGGGAMDGVCSSTRSLPDHPLAASESPEDGDMAGMSL